MIETDAIVVAAEGGRAWVEASRRSSCGHCDASGSCGGALFAELFGNRPVRIEVKNNLGAAVGDHVVLGLPEQVMLRGSLQLYLAPLVGLFLGALLGDYLAGGFSMETREPWAIVGGLLGLLGAPALIRAAGISRNPVGQEPKILRRTTGSVPVELPDFRNQTRQE